MFAHCAWCKVSFRCKVPFYLLSFFPKQGAGQDRLGIYIKSVVAGGAADVDGRLQAGDQLLKVDGQSLVGITQEK